MSTSITKALEQTAGQPSDRFDLFDESQCACGVYQLALLKVAIVVKYGSNIRESAFKFVEEAEAILTKFGVNADAPAPSLSEKLEALKASVGEATFDKLLVNPEVERMAMRAFRKSNEVKSAKALDEIAALFNGAIDPEDLDLVIRDLSEAVDPVAMLSEA